MPKCDFNKVAGKFIEIALRHGCCSVDLMHIFRTPFSENTTGWLLLAKVLQVKTAYETNISCGLLITSKSAR